MIATSDSKIKLENNCHKRNSIAPFLKALILPWFMILIQFSPIFQGNIPLNSDWLAAYCLPWSATISAPVFNPEIDDPVLQHYPLAWRAAQSWKKGEIPLWNPDIACGMPLLADSHSLPLDPIFLFSYLCFADPQWAWTVMLMLQFLILSAVVIFFLMLMECDWIGASFGSTAIAFSSSIVTWSEMRLFSSTVIWLLCALFFLQKAILTKFPQYYLLAGLALAGMQVTGHLQFVIYGWLLFFFFGASRISSEKNLKLRQTVLFGFSVIMGVCFSMLAWLPQLELLTRTMRGEPGRYFPLFRFGMIPWISMICPDFLGNPVHQNYFGLFIYQKSYLNIPIIYIGIIPLFFVFYSLFRKISYRKFWIGCAISILGLLSILDIRLIRNALFRLSPSFFSMDPGRLGAYIPIFLGIAAGLGASRFFEEIRLNRIPFRFIVFFTSIIIFMWLAISLIVIGFHPYFTRIARDNSMLLYLLKLHNENGLIMLFPPVMMSICFAISLLIAALFYKYKLIRPQILFLILALITGIDLLKFSINYMTFSRSSFLKLPQELQAEWPESSPAKGRLCGIDSSQCWNFAGQVLPPNSSLMLGAHDFRGYVSTYVGRYAHFLNELQSRKYYDRRLMPLHSPIYDLAGIRWLFYNSEQRDSSLKLRFSWNELRCYENLAAFPKGWIVYNVKTFKDLHRMFLEIQNRRVHMADTVYFETAEGVQRKEVSPSEPGSVIDLTFSDHRLNFEVRSQAPGFLVVNNTYYPGWRALVNGENRTVMKANYLFQAVEIPSGISTVSLFYRPVSFLLGCFSLLVMLCLGCVFWVIWRKKI